MKLLISLILFLFSLNLYSEESKKDFSQQISSLKLLIKKKQTFYDELKDMQMKTEASEFLAWVYSMRSGERGFLSQVGYFLGPVLPFLVLLDFESQYNHTHQYKRFANKLRSLPLSASLLVIFIGLDQIVLHKGSKEFEEFKKELKELSFKPDFLFEALEKSILEDKKKLEALEKAKDLSDKL